MAVVPLPDPPLVVVVPCVVGVVLLHADRQRVSNKIIEALIKKRLGSTSLTGSGN